MSPDDSLIQENYLLKDSSEAEMRAEADVIFSCIGDGAIATDEFGHITRVNPAALAILGMRAEDVLG